MILRLQWVAERLRTSYWFLPGFLAVIAMGLAWAMPRLDEANAVRELGWTYAGGPDGARGVLSAIASSVIGVAGTTFSITIAVLSLASGQFGPRLLRGFMRDAGNQIVLGSFTATYLYCLLVLRTIRGTERATFVPHLSVTFGVVLATLSVGLLIYFVHHVAASIQVSHIIDEVGRETDATVERLFPKEIGEPKGGAAAPDAEPEGLSSRHIGYVESVDGETLMALAKAQELVVRIEVRPGEYVLPEARLLSVWPALGDHTHAFEAAFVFGRQRTTIQDAEFAFLQLAEVAVRALSPGINDPFTAIQCLDRITASMCLLVQRRWPSPYRSDEAGVLRVIAEPITPGQMVRAAYGLIRMAAHDSPPVLEKLRLCLDVLLDRVENGPLREAILEERERLPKP